MRYHIILTLLYCFAFVSPISGQAAEPPDTPILRVESGFHGALIRRIGVDRAGRFLVSTSLDKTVRLFDAKSGRLLRTMRVPINQANNGKLHGVAISPDGLLIAAAGWTKYGKNKSYCIYLFDRKSGQVRDVLSGLQNTIFDLAFSADGSRLAAVLRGGRGLTVFDLQSKRVLKTDKAYQASSYGVDFSTDGRLVTSCNDGFIRLYDNKLNLLKKVAAPAGKKPYAVRFSPDASEIAVGYQDTHRISILNASDLSLKFSPDTTGVTAGNLLAVTWSMDGQTLYAGGTWNINNKRPVRAWSNQGRGSFQDYPLTRNTILDLRARPGGGFFVGSTDPMLLSLNRQGQTLFSLTPSIADFRKNRKGFQVSADGSRVRFSYTTKGTQPALFDLKQRTLTPAPGVESSLKSPVTSRDGLQLHGWKNTTSPTLNNNSLKIKKNEKSRAACISRDGSRLLLGASWHLYLFDAEGRRLWRISTPSTTWAVNISADGTLALAAFGDGTIRWYRMGDGKELLAFFPHKDQKRWVAWTPSGYYMASPGGEELIGWHINNGREKAADFFSAALFRDTYNRPDVVLNILSSQDESLALSATGQKDRKRVSSQEQPLQLPPVITITAPQDYFSTSQDRLQIHYSLRSPAHSPVKKIRVLVDGRESESARQISRDNEQGGAMEILLPPGQSLISLIAENQNGSSEPSLIKVTRKTALQTEQFMIKPKLYLLAIGISDYNDDSLDLFFAAKDAQDFARAFKNQEGGLYQEVTTKVLTDKGATKDEILDGLDWLEQQTTAKDIAILFVAGHGVNDNHGQYYFLPVDTNLHKLRRTALPYTEIKRTVANVAGKALFFVDTCHSGNVMGSRRATFNVDVDSMVNDLTTAQNGVVVFASSTGNQYSLENQEWQNGAFTKAIVEGIEGGADYGGKGIISINMLDLYLSERVKELTDGRQTPTTTKPKTIQDFPVALKR